MTAATAVAETLLSRACSAASEQSIGAVRKSQEGTVVAVSLGIGQERRHDAARYRKPRSAA
jgi:hypothetical protein